MKSTLCVFLLLLMALCQAAFGTATTHIWSPSTDVQPYLKWHITSDMYLPVETDANGHPIPAVTNEGLTVGVLPFKNFNLEVGADHKSGLGTLDRYPLYVNAKFGVPENAFGTWFPTLAVGIFDHGFKNKVTNFDMVYGKAAKTAGPMGRLSLGYFAGNKKLLLDETGKRANTGIMAAWERTLTEISDKLWLCVDYMGGNSLYGTLNVGASWKFADNVVLLAGYDICNNSKLNLPNTFTLQADIDFDFPAHK